jgi:hypothetical protein
MMMIQRAAILAALLAAPWPAGAAEHWTAYSKTAEAITGDITFSPERITFGNGKSLALASAGVVPGFETLGSRGQSTRYRVTAPDDPVLLNGNRLCGGRTPVPVTSIIVTRLPPQPSTPGLHVLDVFSGTGTSCGTYNFE